MILLLLILILLAGGLIAWGSSKYNDLLPRFISLITLGIDFLIVIIVWIGSPVSSTQLPVSGWMIDYNHDWISKFGISLHFSLDGLSLLMLLLTFFLGILSVLISWKEIKYQTGFFHFNLLWILAGLTGVFLATDLLLFFFFWELMLIPMYFLIGIWGHEKRIYASYKFFIYTQASGLLMFLSIIALYYMHGHLTGIYTFDYNQLIGTIEQYSLRTPNSQLPTMIMLGFLMAFIVKLPVVPFHNWLPDAHTEAPTAGSVILAGILLKTGAYGLLRFVVPLFPEAAHQFAPYGMILGVIGILYGAKLAFAQTDFKRLVAYTSVSHMGFIMLGVFAFNKIAYQGVVMQMITHGISTGALFIIVGSLYERIHTRDLNKMGGFWQHMPRMGGAALIFSMASLGLPGLGNFIAEFLTLVGAFQANKTLTGLASLGLIASAVYSLRIMQKVFYGKQDASYQLPASSYHDYKIREMIIIVSLIVVIFWLGIYPKHVLNTSEPSITKILSKQSGNTNPSLVISRQ